MKKIFQIFAAKPALRYLAVIAVVLLAGAASWFIAMARNDPDYRPIVPCAAYLLATPIWIVLAAVDRRRKACRLLLTWAPTTPIIALLLPIMLYPSQDLWERDSQGIAGVILLPILMAMALLCTIGSAAVLASRARD